MGEPTFEKVRPVSTPGTGKDSEMKLSDVKTPLACIETAVRDRKEGLKVNLPKVCEKFVLDVKPTKDKDGGGPNN